MSPELEPIEVVVKGDPKNATVVLMFPEKNLVITLSSGDAELLAERIKQTARMTMAGRGDDAH